MPEFVPPAAIDPPGSAPSDPVNLFKDIDIGNTGVFGDGEFAADWIVYFNLIGIAQGCDGIGVPITDLEYCANEHITNAGFPKTTG